MATRKLSKRKVRRDAKLTPGIEACLWMAADPTGELGLEGSALEAKLKELWDAFGAEATTSLARRCPGERSPLFWKYSLPAGTERAYVRLARDSNDSARFHAEREMRDLQFLLQHDLFLSGEEDAIRARDDSRQAALAASGALDGEI